LMVVVALFLMALMVMGLTMDGPSLAKERFAAELLLAAADLFGVLVGAAMAVLFFAVVLYFYESTHVPVYLPAPTEEQLQHAERIIADNVLGGEEA